MWKTKTIIIMWRLELISMDLEGCNCASDGSITNPRRKKGGSR